MIIPLLRAGKARIESAFTLLDASRAKSVVEFGHEHVKKCGGGLGQKQKLPLIYTDSNNLSETI